MASCTAELSRLRARMQALATHADKYISVHVDSPVVMSVREAMFVLRRRETDLRQRLKHMQSRRSGKCVTLPSREAPPRVPVREKTVFVDISDDTDCSNAADPPLITSLNDTVHSRALITLPVDSPGVDQSPVFSKDVGQVFSDRTDTPFITTLFDARPPTSNNIPPRHAASLRIDEGNSSPHYDCVSAAAAMSAAITTLLWDTVHEYRTAADAAVLASSALLDRHLKPLRLLNNVDSVRIDTLPPTLGIPDSAHVSRVLASGIEGSAIGKAMRARRALVSALVCAPDIENPLFVAAMAECGRSFDLSNPAAILPMCVHPAYNHVARERTYVSKPDAGAYVHDGPSDERALRSALDAAQAAADAFYRIYYMYREEGAGVVLADQDASNALGAFRVLGSGNFAAYEIMANAYFSQHAPASPVVMDTREITEAAVKKAVVIMGVTTCTDTYSPRFASTTRHFDDAHTRDIFADEEK